MPGDAMDELCGRHPQHTVVGVCAHCLHDRLYAVFNGEDAEGYALLRSFSNGLHPDTNISSSDPSTRPETPFSVGSTLHTAPWVANDHFSLNSTPPRASVAHKLFSLSFSPQRQVVADSLSSSSICSPRRQVHGENHDFIKGEACKEKGKTKKKKGLWAFLHRHKKTNLYNACGAGQIHPNLELDDCVARRDRIPYGDSVHLQHHNRQKAHAISMHPSSQSMRSGADMLRLEKHGRSEVASSPNMMSLRRENARVHSISPLSNLGFRNHNQKLSISKQTYPNSSSISRGFKTNIGFSPLSNEGFTRDKKPSQASTDALNKYVHTNRDYDGISSPWAPSISTQKFRRSKSISAASEISNVGRHSSFSSPESKISKQKSVTFSKHVYYGSPLWNDMQRSSYRSPSKEKRVQRYIGSPHVNVLKRMPRRSRLNDHEQDVLGHLEGNQSILPNRLNHSAVLSSSHPVSHDPIAHVNSDRIQSPRPANMLLPRSKDDSVSVECGKVRRVSPLFLSTHSKSSSPGSRSQQGLGQSSLPLSMHNLHGSRAETGTYVLPNASRFEDGSDLLVSDEHCNFNGMAQQRINSRTLTIMREDKAEAYHHSGDLKKEPASSSYEFPNSTKGWSKALGGMLGIRRKKKDSIKDQPLSYMINDYTHHHIHSMALHSDQHQDHADDDDDDSDFIDYDPKDLYHDDFCRHQHYLPHLPCRQPLKIHRAQSRKPQISRITETARSSQKYSFLKKDYGAFSH